MSTRGLFPCLAAGLGFTAFVCILVSEITAYRRSVENWAARDLEARTQLASDAIGDAVSTGDFARLRASGDALRGDSIRLTVLHPSGGGVIYDSQTAAFGDHRNRSEVLSARQHGFGHAIRLSATTGERMLYCARIAEDAIVRLSIPYAQVIEPFRRSRIVLWLAGLVGASAFLFIFLALYRLSARIREKEQLVATLRRAEAYRRDFIANFTHELKTPLTGIQGAADLLDTPVPPAETERKTLLALIRREVTRLTELVQNILMLARLENAAAVARDSFAETDLTALLHVVKDRLAPRTEAAGVRLTVVAPDTLPAVCQSEFLEHALVNLIDNALRYSGTEEITLTAAATADRLLISVEDHGIGIPPEHHARIFERFYRVDASHQRASGGTGLGLAIVKHIARLHQGDVTLTVPDGGGSCFTLSLPRSPFSH